VVRIASGGLVYSGMLRQAEFSGGVRAETVDGTIRANEATVYLVQQAQAGKGATVPGDAVPFFAGEVESVVAAGKVELDQPGTRATGERLVYTASEQTALLTGDSKAPPRAVSAQGTTTGAVLRFNLCDDSIEVLGEPEQPARTDAQTGKVGGNGKETR
jgi:lipopolysaccharide export system protein LptA